MKKLQSVQNSPVPKMQSITQGNASGKSNATLIQQLQNLTRESAVSGPKIPKLDVAQVNTLCPNPQEVTVPVPDLAAVESVGLSQQEIAVPIPDSLGTGVDSGSQGKYIPNVTVPISDIPKIGMVPQPVTVPIPNMQVYTRPVQNQNETSPTPTSSGPTSGGGGNTGAGGQIHRVYHDFNNKENKDISLTYTGGIQSVTSESKVAPDGFYSTGLDAKHYTITFFNDVNHIQVSPGEEAAGGALDAGIVVAKIQKITPKEFKVWFNRGKGANTYVNQFSVEGI
ncbi:MAG: hypothetical protein CL916_07495 [Deltaproteobacteria bacterium]|nr:hypothetical protein [Deltaproteobacteria bacterium]